jgi:hypothetical protein
MDEHSIAEHAVCGPMRDNKVGDGSRALALYKVSKPRPVVNIIHVQAEELGARFQSGQRKIWAQSRGGALVTYK